MVSFMNYNHFSTFPVSPRWYYKDKARNVFGIPLFTFESEKKLMVSRFGLYGLFLLLPLWNIGITIFRRELLITFCISQMYRIFWFFNLFFHHFILLKHREFFNFNPLQPGVAFLYPLKTSETFRFSDVFKGCREATPGCIELS